MTPLASADYVLCTPMPGQRRSCPPPSAPEDRYRKERSMTRVRSMPRPVIFVLIVALLLPASFSYLAHPRPAAAAEIGLGLVNLVTSNNVSYGAQVIAYGRIEPVLFCPDHPTNGSKNDIPPV